MGPYISWIGWHWTHSSLKYLQLYPRVKESSVKFAPVVYEMVNILEKRPLLPKILVIIFWWRSNALVPSLSDTAWRQHKYWENVRSTMLRSCGGVSKIPRITVTTSTERRKCDAGYKTTMLDRMSAISRMKFEAITCDTEIIYATTLQMIHSKNNCESGLSNKPLLLSLDLANYYYFA